MVSSFIQLKNQNLPISLPITTLVRKLIALKYLRNILGIEGFCTKVGKSKYFFHLTWREQHSTLTDTSEIRYKG